MNEHSKMRITPNPVLLCRTTLLLSAALLPIVVTGQDEQKEPPALLMPRAEENYAYLNSPATYRPAFGDPLKYISLFGDKNAYLTLGGQYRARFESFTNKDWSDNNEHYYSQRLAVYASLELGNAIRFFGELYHGYTTSEDRFLEDDDIDLHQGFVEITPLSTQDASLSLRLGRQEFGFGASRLTGIREGPNMRRSFDVARVIYRFKKSSFNLLYGKEVNPQPGAFDNESNLFGESEIGNPVFWGLYTQGPSPIQGGMLDLYYLGFNSVFSTFSDVQGEETRHSLGIRSSGSLGDFSYNTELIYQFGTIGDSDISAFNLEADWKYQVASTRWKPTIGVKLDFSTGDRTLADGKVQTFNPLFVNPAIYSLAAVNTPANITSFHPNLTVLPIDRVSVYLDYALFYRTQETDGFYSPPRFQTRPADGITPKHIGDVVGLQINYEINRNVSFDLRSSYFIAGAFIEATGSLENTFYIAPTLSFKF